MSKNVMFLLGDPEYFSHESMPPFSKDVAKQLGVKTTVSISTVITTSRISS